MQANKPSRNAFRIYTLHSQKGGVGKTSLAIAIAGLEAAKNRAKTLLLDMDMTGTCLADALGVPPRVRTRKKWLNDLLLATPEDFLRLTHPDRSSMTREASDRWHPFLAPAPWTSKVNGSLKYIASNPDFDAVRQIVPSLAQECHLHFYADRLQHILSAAAGLGYQSVIVDLPPGMFGLSVAAFYVITDGLLEESLGTNTAPIQRLGLPIVVSTTDKADYRAAIPTIMQLEDEIEKEIKKYAQARTGAKRKSPAKGEFQPPLPFASLWFNKAPRRDPVFEVRNILEDMEKLFRSKQMKDRIGEDKTLKKWIARLAGYRKKIAEPGARTLRWVPDFDMTRILEEVAKYARATEQGGARAKGRNPMQQWVHAVYVLMSGLQSSVT